MPKKYTILKYEYNEFLPQELDSAKRNSIYYNDIEQYLYMEPATNGLNLMELVGSKYDYQLKMNKLMELKDATRKFDSSINGARDLALDIYYNFAKNFNSLPLRSQRKQIDLAIKVVKLIKRGDRKYMIDLKRKGEARLVIDFFNLGLSDHRLNELGFNYRQGEVSYKKMIQWADSLAKEQIITNERYNQFMAKLEELSNAKVI